MSKKKDFDHRYMMTAGATPKLTKSASESSSTPKLEFDFSSLANFPSRLSKNEENTIKVTATSHFSSIANFIDESPRVREIKVIKFGIRLLKDNFFIIVRVYYLSDGIFFKSAIIVSPPIVV